MQKFTLTILPANHQLTPPHAITAYTVLVNWPVRTYPEFEPLDCAEGEHRHIYRQCPTWHDAVVAAKKAISEVPSLEAHEELHQNLLATAHECLAITVEVHDKPPIVKVIREQQRLP